MGIPDFLKTLSKFSFNNAMTWPARGFGAPGGTAKPDEIDSEELEPGGITAAVAVTAAEGAGTGDGVSEFAAVEIALLAGCPPAKSCPTAHRPIFGA